MILQISAVQVLVNYPGDPNGLDWHRRILLHRVGGGNGLRHDLRAAFSADVAAAVYAHDPIGRAMLLQFKRQAQVMADILGDGMVEELDSVLWIVADPRHKGFGTEVDAGLLTNEATGVAFTTKGIVVLEGVEVFVERVSWPHGEQQGDAKHT